MAFKEATAKAQFLDAKQGSSGLCIKLRGLNHMICIPWICLVSPRQDGQPVKSALHPPTG